MRRIFLLALLSLWPLCVAAQQPIPPVQVPPTCDEQLATVTTMLAFLRANRQFTEETAGRVVAQLQVQIDTLRRDLDALHHAASSSTSATKDQR